MKTLEITNPIFGADIELFLKDKNTGKFITAEGLVKGTKERPFKFNPENKYYATSLDCTSVEYNIPPVTNPYDMWNSIELCTNYIKSIIPDNLELSYNPSVWFEDDQLQSRIARTFGCEPSLTCYSDEEVRPLNTGSNLRVIGGHIHCSYDEGNPITNRKVVRAMDLFLGVPSILIEPSNNRRSSGYGIAGNYRNQFHSGFEYRTLSSYFTSEQKLVEWVFRGTERAIDFVNNGDMEELLNIAPIIQDTINGENKKIAERLVKNFNIELV